MKKIVSLFLLVILTAFSTTYAQQKQLMFDLAHGQFQDKFVDPSYYDYVIPEYKEILARNDVAYVENKEEITSKSLKGIDVLLMLSPLARENQKPITETEKEAIIKFIRKGGSVILMVDEESHRVNLDEYGANDITKEFGIEIGDDIEDVPGNCGAISFENEIFNGRREVPYSGSRHLKGGIPASVCMEGGYLHASYVKLEHGGKLYVIGETMVGLLMGYPDGERNVHKGMKTRWWGKDSKLYMEELIQWCLDE